MRQNLVQFLAMPNKKLVYLGANGIYESVDYSDDFGPTTSRMKLRGGDPTAGREPYFFRNLTPTPLPERSLLGVAYESINTFDQSIFAPYGVLLPQHRFFQGINPPLVAGSSIGATGLNGSASGWEMDTSAGPGAVPNVQVLATGENVSTDGTVRYGADMAYYDTPSGGFVFSVGSLAFGGCLAVDPQLQAIVNNVLRECV
jgi:hypothetical protein